MKKLLLVAAILYGSVLSFGDAKADYESAKKLVQDNKITDAVKILEKIATSGDKEYETRANFDLGLYYFQNNDNTKAKKYLSSVWNNGSAVTAESLEAAKVLYLMSIQSKNITEAEKYIAWADKSTQGQDPDLVSSLIIFYFENKMDAKAQSRYNSAIKSTNKDFVAEINLSLGQYYAGKNDMTKAKKYLQDSYKGTPNAILPAGYFLYQIALSEKDNATAEKYLLEMNKQSQNKNSEILGLLGNYYLGTNDLVKAEDYLKKSVNADSKNGESLFLLLALYESKKDTVNTNATYNKLKTIVPKGLNKELGINYAGIGNAELAEKYFKKSINEDKDNEAKMLLGQLYFLVGKQTEGINLVKEAVNAKVKGADEVLKEMQSAVNSAPAKQPSTKK